MTTLFGNTAGIVIPAPKKKHSLLPVLTVLFIISYGMMTMLIVEQGSVIQSQRNLIKLLFSDSVQLSAMKGKAITDRQVAKSRGQAQAAPSTQAQARNQSNPAPYAQTPSNQVPSTQGIPQQQHGTNRSGKMAKPGSQLPPVPAADLVDHRRALVTI